MKTILSAAAALALVLAGEALADAHKSGHHVSRHAPHAVTEAYYTNSSGHAVRRPTFSPSRPAGASARCGDGSYSFSEHRRGTCSHHGGVARWY